MGGGGVVINKWGFEELRKLGAIGLRKLGAIGRNYATTTALEENNCAERFRK